MFRTRSHASKKGPFSRYAATTILVAFDAGVQGSHINNQNAIYRLRPEARSRLRSQLERELLTGRGYHRIRRVARTVSDLRDQSECVDDVHVAVALALRVGVQPQFSGDKVVQA